MEVAGELRFHMYLCLVRCATLQYIYEQVAERWARLAMPNNAPPDAVYRPICPYCAKPLQCKNGERPYSKMIFAR